MTDFTVKLCSTIAVAGLSFGLWAVWSRQQFMLLAIINAAVAFGILLMSARNVAAAIRYNETPMLLLFAFEVSVLLALGALLLGVRVPGYAIVTQATINLLLMAALMIFLFTFRITRLF